MRMLNKDMTNWFKRDLLGSINRSEELVGDLKLRFNLTSTGQISTAEFIFSLFLDPVVLIILSGFGFLGALMDSLINILPFINTRQSSFLKRLKREPLSFLLFSVLIMALGLGYINPALPGGSAIYILILTLLEVMFACLFLHYYLKYRKFSYY